MRRCVNALALHTVKLKIKKISLESSREMDARRRRGGRGELRQRRSKGLGRKGGKGGDIYSKYIRRQTGRGEVDV
jgi:hypothetical protein